MHVLSLGCQVVALLEARVPLESGRDVAANVMRRPGAGARFLARRVTVTCFLARVTVTCFLSRALEQAHSSLTRRRQLDLHSRTPLHQVLVSDTVLVQKQKLTYLDGPSTDFLGLLFRVGVDSKSSC